MQRVSLIGAKSVMAEITKQLEAQKAKLTQDELVSLVKDLKEATPVDTGEARDGWRLEGNAIVNDVEHLSDLNDGSSQQAPAHFVEQTVLKHILVKPNGVIVTQK
jgi:hypothetical protein